MTVSVPRALSPLRRGHSACSCTPYISMNYTVGVNRFKLAIYIIRFFWYGFLLFHYEHMQYEPEHKPNNPFVIYDFIDKLVLINTISFYFII